MNKSSSLVDIELGSNDDVPVRNSSNTSRKGDDVVARRRRRKKKHFYQDDDDDDDKDDECSNDDNSSIETTPSQEGLLLSNGDINDPTNSRDLPDWLTKPLGDNWIEIIEDDFLHHHEYEELYNDCGRSTIVPPPDDCFASVTGGWQRRYLSNSTTNAKQRLSAGGVTLPKIHDLPLYEYIPLAARELVQQAFNKSVYYARVGTMEMASQFHLNSFPKTSDLGIAGGYTYNSSSSNSMRGSRPFLRTTNYYGDNHYKSSVAGTEGDDMSASAVTTATTSSTSAFGPFCSADSYFDSLMFAEDELGLPFVDEHSYNNHMIDRHQIIQNLPPFSSLSWLDRQLVEEWRTLHNDDLKELVEIQNVLVLKRRRRQQRRNDKHNDIDNEHTQQSQQRQLQKQGSYTHGSSVVHMTTNAETKAPALVIPETKKKLVTSTRSTTFSPSDIDVSQDDKVKEDDEDMIEDDDDVEYTRVRTLIPPPAPKPQWAHLSHCSLCPKPVNTHMKDNPNPPFGTLRRRHHCRLCGTSVCSKHGNYAHPLPQLGYHPSISERVCILCKILLVKQDWSERQAWKLCRVRDYFNGNLTPYFTPGVDSMGEVASRFTTLTLHISRKLPTIVMGPQTTLALETIDLVRKHGLNAVFGFLLRKEFIQASELLMKVIGIDKQKWPISWKEMTLGIFYALAAEKYRRGTRPTHEAYIHRFRLPPISMEETKAPASQQLSSSSTYVHNDNDARSSTTSHSVSSQVVPSTVVASNSSVVSSSSSHGNAKTLQSAQPTQSPLCTISTLVTDENGGTTTTVAESNVASPPTEKFDSQKQAEDDDINEVADKITQPPGKNSGASTTTSDNVAATNDETTTSHQAQSGLPTVVKKEEDPTNTYSGRMSPSTTTTLRVEENPVLEELVNELLEQAEARAAITWQNKLNEKVRQNRIDEPSSFGDDAHKTTNDNKNTSFKNVYIDEKKNPTQRQEDGDDDDYGDDDDDDHIQQTDPDVIMMKEQQLLLLKENEYSTEQGGVCDYVSDQTLAECLWYGPLALMFLYAETEIELQLLAAQQGWRLLYSHLHPLDNISREMGQQQNGNTSTTNTSSSAGGSPNCKQSRRRHNKETHQKRTSSGTTSKTNSNKGRKSPHRQTRNGTTTSSTSHPHPHSNDEEEDEEEDGVLDKPAYAVLVHEDEKVACWGIRGTATLSDIVMDIRAMPVPFPQNNEDLIVRDESVDDENDNHEDNDEANPKSSGTQTSKKQESRTNTTRTKKQHKKLDSEAWGVVPIPETSESGMALCGMARAATNLFRDNIAVMDEFLQKGYKIRITGHSLGGGVGALLGILLQRYIQRVYHPNNSDTTKESSSSSEQNTTTATKPVHGEPLEDNIQDTTKVPCTKDEVDNSTTCIDEQTTTIITDANNQLPSLAKDVVRVFGYGTPACIDKVLAKESSKFTTTVILHDDVIPRLTPTSIRNLLKYLMLVKQTWVDQHFQKDVQSIVTRAKQVWAPRLRGSFVLPRRSNTVTSHTTKTSGPATLTKVGGTSTNTLDNTSENESTMESKFNATLLMADEAFFASEHHSSTTSSTDDNHIGRQHSLLESLDSDDDAEDYCNEGGRYNFEWTNVSGALRPTSEEQRSPKKKTSPRGLHESSSSWSQVPFDEPPLDADTCSRSSMESFLGDDEVENETDEFETQDDDDDDDPVLLSETPLPKMYIPGTIVHIYTHKGTYKAAHVPRQFRELRRISLAGNMLSDHTSRAYYEALLEVQSVRRASEECPDWIGFQESSMCSCCASRFTWASTSDSAAQEARDKHNCRACGQLVCGPCSTNQTALPKYGIQTPVRICDACYYNLGVV